MADDAVSGTLVHREQATLEVAPARVRDVLAYLRDDDEEPWPRLMSLHGCDYLPRSRASACTTSCSRWSAATG